MGLSNLGIAKVVRCHLLPCPGRAPSRTPPTPAKMGPLCPPASTLRWHALAQVQNTLTLCPSRVVTLATIAILPFVLDSGVYTSLDYQILGSDLSAQRATRRCPYEPSPGPCPSISQSQLGNK